PIDEGAVMARLAARRRHHVLLRRIRAGVLAVVVVAGTVVGLAVLRSIFPSARTGPGTPIHLTGNGVIAFARGERLIRTPGTEEASIVVMQPDGSGARRIRTGLVGTYRLAWSPDGTRLAFTQTTG